MVNGISRVIEILVWTLAIVSLIILVLLVVGGSPTEKSTVITNSYNTNTNPSISPSYSSYPQDSSRGFPTRSSSYVNYGSPYRPPSYSDSKPYVVDRYPYAREYYVRNDLRYTKSNDGYLRYDDWGRRNRVKGIFGNDIDRYEVYVGNKGYTGGYFKVNFYFKDYYGRIRTESTSRYISPRGESRFVFKDISREKYNYPYWSYKVTSQTKVPTKVYYNSYSTRTIYSR